MENCVRCQRWQINDQADDRLSSLSDAILTKTLSLLPTDSAAATSILSHRWHCVWTGVNNFNFQRKHGEYAPLHPIALQLTSPDLRFIDVDIKGTKIHIGNHTDWVSAFDVLCNRNVEEIKVTSSLDVPPAVFNSPSLVNLEVDCACFSIWELHRLLPYFPRLEVIHLPCLKKLRLCLGILNLELFGTVVRSCPILEELCVVSNVMTTEKADLSAPNLKLFVIERGSSDTRHNEIYIDAPNLENLKIRDSRTVYKFVQDPTKLATAHYDNMYKMNYDWDNEFYYEEVAKFVQQLTSANKVYLKISIMMSQYFVMEDGEAMKRFHNLTRFGTILDCDYDWKHLLRFCNQFLPNLEELEVRLGPYASLETGNWYEPDFEVEYNLLSSKLKKITIKSLQLNDDEIKMIECILDKASSLEELNLRTLRFMNKCPNIGVQNEYKFCEALFKLPRSSWNSNVVFKGDFIITSSNAIENGLHKDEIDINN